MRPEEYRQIMKKLETHFEEFKIMSHGSEMFADEDKTSIENQVAGAQAHYDKLVVELPTYCECFSNCTLESFFLLLKYHILRKLNIYLSLKIYYLKNRSRLYSFNSKS